MPPSREARARIAELVELFRRNEADYRRTTYNETQARTEFISPLLEAFGWDVRNQTGLPLGIREVIEEATVEVGEERLSKKPDYELRLAKQRKIFVEAKKPSVNIETDRAAAFQARRYGFSASLPITILTNFRHIAIYDCIHKPALEHEAHVARRLLIPFEELEARFDELWDLISRESVYSGAFDRTFEVDVTRRGAEQFDDYFLEQVSGWREKLAIDIHANNHDLNLENLTYVVQRFLLRIVFLRICEDRDIERYETLRGLPTANTFDALMNELRRADTFYDSGLFSLIGEERLRVRIGDETLKNIIEELYYPHSPYTFSVVEAEVLGEIYEQFLGQVIKIEGEAVTIIEKPEVRESGGVVPTPRFIVDAIVERTMAPLLEGRAPNDLNQLTVADVCCGSGVFLLSALDYLCDFYLRWYLENNRGTHVGTKIYEAGMGSWKLTLEEKRRILLKHIRGVDIDYNAVEVARFSLLLKLIENETAEGLRNYTDRERHPVLPSIDGIIRSGNSLVSQTEWNDIFGRMSTELVDKINPFNWATEFPDEMGRGGFSAIVGNPPYIRIQKMVEYSPEEIDFYQNNASPYSTAQQDNFDKYALFIERCLSILQEAGRLGYIVPHKFMNTRAGRTLRVMLTQEEELEYIVHFGVAPVFGRDVSNYTCILVIDKNGSDEVTVEQVRELEAWRYGSSGQVSTYTHEELGADNWQFATESARALFQRIRDATPNVLDDVADILVGAQTSNDPAYIIHPRDETATHVVHNWNGRNWNIEKTILRPILHDARLQPFAHAIANAWIIFPYRIEGDRRGKPQARLIQPAEFQRLYPNCWEYLSARQEELEGRNITGGIASERQWYQYGRSQSLTKFDTPKIVFPVLALDVCYSYDHTNTMITGGGNGPYYMLRPAAGQPISNFYLLAVLNHPLCEAMIRSNTSVFSGGYYSHGKQYIEELPIPIPSEEIVARIDRLVEELIGVTDEINSSLTPQQRIRRERQAAVLKAQIDAEISAVYGISEEEFEIIKSVEAPT